MWCRLWVVGFHAQLQPAIYHLQLSSTMTMIERSDRKKEEQQLFVLICFVRGCAPAGEAQPLVRSRRKLRAISITRL